MFEHKNKLSTDETEDLLGDLELNTPEEIRRLSKSSRMSLRMTIEARLAGASHLGEDRVLGRSEEISKKRVLGVYPRPLRVGDIYQIRFDEEQLKHAPVLGVCSKCRLINEESFEALIQLYTPVDLSSCVDS